MGNDRYQDAQVRVRQPRTPAMTAAVLDHDDRVLDAIGREFRPVRSGTKILARRGGDVSPKTSRNWLARLSAPSLSNLIELMASCPAVRVEVDRIVAEREAAIKARMNEHERRAFEARLAVERFRSGL